MPTSKQDQSFGEVMRDSVDEVRMSRIVLDNALDWIRDNLDPDDIFDDKKLESWAESNGYKKE